VRDTVSLRVASSVSSSAEIVMVIVLLHAASDHSKLARARMRSPVRARQILIPRGRSAMRSALDAPACSS